MKLSLVSTGIEALDFFLVLAVKTPVRMILVLILTGVLFFCVMLPHFHSLVHCGGVIRMMLFLSVV